MPPRSLYSDSNQYQLQIPIEDLTEVKKKMLHWANRYSIFCFLDNNNYDTHHHSVECLLAAGVKRTTKTTSLKAVQDLLDKPSWLFGHLSYDLKNEIHHTISSNTDEIGFPDLFFFEPEAIIQLEDDKIIVHSDDAEKILDQIMKYSYTTSDHTAIDLNTRMSRDEYIRTIEQVREHIHRGDCYELNYCQEFYSKGKNIDPVQVYFNLAKVSPNPFSVLYKLNEKYVICASPERYLKKKGSKLISQPIKGTSSRSSDPLSDDINKRSLQKSEKDRSENVMVVDLVRNDLSRVCVEGSVKVDELFGVYSYPQVHQMISTVSGTVSEEVTFTDIVRATFPMGSMTGAPKLRVMELIEKYEKTKRGIFSGAIGYIDPDGDFDFNVVIRSIMYNEAKKYISIQAGSGITFYSDSEQEYEECLLKAKALFKVLE